MRFSFFSFLAAIAIVFLFSPVANLLAQESQARWAFPRDASVLDAKRDLGAVGDGKHDDTDALQKGIDLSSGYNERTTKILFIPNGIYRVTKSLVVKNALGPWLYGESRDGVVLKLDDGAKDVTAVVRTHPNEKGPTSADWFMRNLRNFTIDVGDNPETDGIRYYATNSGILQNVRVIGKGKVGINSGFLDQSGPNLIQDCEVEGFETGLLSQWIWGQTASRLTIRNCKLGVKVVANVLAAEDLVIENCEEPIRCEIPSDWYWWGGVVSLVGGKITGKNNAKPAIFNQSVLFARDVEVSGYKQAIESTTPGGNVEKDIQEYQSHPLQSVFDSTKFSQRLAIKREPKFVWETDAAKWECANEHGAIAGDNQDDTAAIQKAIDSAAKAGKTVVYFRGTGGGDPNWYNLQGDVRVHGSVRHILGLGFGRILGTEDGKGRFVIDDASAKVVKFQHIDAFGGTGVSIENRSKDRALVVESCGVKVLGTGTGDIFMTDCPSLLELGPGANAWCRQFNPEGNSDDGLAKNNGGKLWVLGLKTEGHGVRVATKNGGGTEIFGSFIYAPTIAETDRRPIFSVDNASLSVQGLREISFGNNYYVKVRETRGKETRELGRPDGHGWIGWSLMSAWVNGKK